MRTTQHCLQVAAFGAGLVLLGLLWPVGLGAQDMPVPPCGPPAQPAFPDPGAPPNLQVWNDRASNAAWVPPSCTGWTEPGFRMLVALAASFRFDGNGKDLLGRFGAVSAFRGIQYWSASDKSWRVLITDAAALEGRALSTDVRISPPPRWEFESLSIFCRTTAAPPVRSSIDFRF